MPRDWDDAYANAAHIPGGADYPARWAAQAAAFRSAQPPRVLAYGGHFRQRIDIFEPGGVRRGLAVFVHGGYWCAFDRSDWSHLAAGPLARGWAVAVPGYVLAPEARIADITLSVARAVATCAAEIPGPIRLAGHSAGGHLAVRQICDDSALPEAVADRIERVVSISGLHDLRPLLMTAMNEELNLDREGAAAESPALHWPLPGAKVHVWAGADERPEFLRQSALIENIWSGLGASMRFTLAPHRHHFDVVQPLAEPGSPLVAAFLDSWC